MSNSGLLEAFMQTRPALLRYLTVRGATAEEAEDILQDIGLKLSTDQVGLVDQPRAYLYRMATNHFLLHRRTAGRRARREEAWVDAHSGASRATDQTPSAEARIMHRQRLALLQRALDALPERTRQIFRRFRIDGEPQRAIAADIDISVSAVEKHLARAYEAVADVKRRIDEDAGSLRSLRGLGGHHDD
ncbi:hypothetical protein ASE85_11540 [Sphingobium sp. Leaf26]|uniref:RNA polymerase sigma factor n=1 Tax=Sphingobium sp. Leaf26 TaxID=1735693 RepID=UPI0006F21463|nr:sigma-70 family RNA polymerase sigma factor [Sphingobium sp. Leaf26]KQM99321.1 hypothetical protein ASE85_11540 [Sphingobium sp. Leaf26]